VLIVDEPVRESVMTKPTSRQLQRVAVDKGMRTLWESGFARVKRGETPLEEILRVVATEHRTT